MLDTRRVVCDERERSAGECWLDSANLYTARCSVAYVNGGKKQGVLCRDEGGREKKKSESTGWVGLSYNHATVN